MKGRTLRPKWKVYRHGGEYVAGCKYAEDAAALVAIQGHGARVKLDHKLTVWHEGHETHSAGEAYTGAAITMHRRAKKHYEKTQAERLRAMARTL
jgi:hypothetical protein